MSKRPDFSNYLVDKQKVDLFGKTYICKAMPLTLGTCKDCDLWELLEQDRCPLPEGMHCEGCVKWEVPSVILKEIE